MKNRLAQRATPVLILIGALTMFGCRAPIHERANGAEMGKPVIVEKQEKSGLSDVVPSKRKKPDAAQPVMNEPKKRIELKGLEPPPDYKIDIQMEETPHKPKKGYR